MSTRRLVVWITFLAIFAMAARVSMDTDTWWHLRAGQWMLDHRAVPRSDPFSFTRFGQPWEYPGWLVEVPMTLIYNSFGPGGLNIWTAAMVTLAFAFIWLSLRGGVFLRAFLLVLAAAASGVYWAARPYLVTFVLAAVFIWILDDYRWSPGSASKRRLWWLPGLMILWANSHGGFAVGFLLWGVYFANAVFQQAYEVIFHKQKPVLKGAVSHLLWLGVGLVAAVCVNPYGPVMLLYPFKTAGIQALQEYIQEWQSPNFQSLQVQPFLWLIFLVLAAVGISRKRLAFTDFALAAGFAYMGMLAGRNIALFGLAAPLVISRHLAPVLESFGRKLGYHPATASKPAKQVIWVNRFLLLLLSLVVVLKVSLVVPSKVNLSAFEKGLPVGAVNYLNSHLLPGKLFNSYNWGGYLLWNLPEYPVFIDGRTDLYDDELVEAWLGIARAEGDWEQALRGYGANLVLIEPTTPLAGALQAHPAWKLEYQDEVSVIYWQKGTP